MLVETGISNEARYDIKPQDMRMKTVHKNMLSITACLLAKFSEAWITINKASIFGMLKAKSSFYVFLHRAQYIVKQMCFRASSLVNLQCRKLKLLHVLLSTIYTLCVSVKTG